MELKQEQGEIPFKWEDVTFFVKARADAGDKHALDMAFDIGAKGGHYVPSRDVYRQLIPRFVRRWENVTVDGKPVPFSMEALESFPASSVIVSLGSFIIEKCGLITSAKEADRKKA